MDPALFSKPDGHLNIFESPVRTSPVFLKMLLEMSASNPWISVNAGPARVQFDERFQVLLVLVNKADHRHLAVRYKLDQTGNLMVARIRAAGHRFEAGETQSSGHPKPQIL